jgi:hypothetical protein
VKRLLALAVLALAILGPLEAEASAGTIEGTVTPIQWAPEVEVCVVGTVICTLPKANGTYQLGGTPEVVKLQFVPSFRSGLITQYYNHKRLLSEATNLAVPSDHPLTNINADLLAGGVFEGTVTAAGTGTPLKEVEVCAVSTEAGKLRVCAETDATGAYVIHSLPLGSYTVRYFGSGASAEYAPAVFSELPSGAASAIATAEGQVRTGVDAEMAVGARVEGLVTAAGAGTPLADTSVCLFAAAAQAAQRCTFTDGAGSYAFRGLADGTYQVGFSLEGPEIGGLLSGGGADGLESQFWNGVATRAQATPIALLGPAVAVGVNAALAPPATPAPIAPPVAVTAPLVAAPPAIAIPTQKKPVCKKPKRRQKVKGKVRCVKPKPKPKKHKPAKHRKRAAKKGRKKA